jgi:hypothetical protein
MMTEQTLKHRSCELLCHGMHLRTCLSVELMSTLGRHCQSCIAMRAIEAS